MANNNKALRRTFELVDKATRPLRGIQRGFRAMGQTGTRALASLRAAQRRLHLDQLAGSFTAVGRAARTAFAPVGRLFTSVAALVGLGGAGGLVSIVTGFGKAGDNIAKAAGRLGMEVERYQELLYASDLGGVGEAAFGTAARTLNQRVADAASGKNKDLAQIFKALGIELRDVNGELRGAGDLLPDLAEAFRVNENAALRGGLANRLFGESGAGMINVLKGGREELARLSAEAREHGLVTGEQARQAEAQVDAIARLSRAWAGLRNLIGAGVAPVIIPLIRSLQEWINANRELIAARVQEVIREIVIWLREVDWIGLARGARDFARSVNALVDRLGGWKVAMAALAALMASGMIANVLVLAGALGKLAIAITVTAAKLALLAFGPVVAALGNLIVALRAGYGAMAAFNLVMTANPIGVLVVAIGALIAALALLVIYWDDIAAAAKMAWDAMVSGAVGAWEKIKPIVESMKEAFAAFTRGGPLGLLMHGAGKLFGGGDAGSLAGAAAQNNASRIDVSGKTDVKVRFENAPPGTRVQSSSEGRASESVDVGYGLLAQP